MLSEMGFARGHRELIAHLDGRPGRAILPDRHFPKDVHLLHRRVPQTVAEIGGDNDGRPLAQARRW